MDVMQTVVVTQNDFEKNQKLNFVADSVFTLKVYKDLFGGQRNGDDSFPKTSKEENMPIRNLLDVV